MQVTQVQSTAAKTELPLPYPGPKALNIAGAKRGNTKPAIDLKNPTAASARNVQGQCGPLSIKSGESYEPEAA